MTNESLGILLGVLYALFLAALYIWTALALSAVFRKMGEEPWKAWVPVLNSIVLLRRAGFSGWLVLLAFVPVVNIAFLVIWIMACHRVGADFGLGVGMTVLAALVFPVWASVVGWGSARYLPADAPHTTGPLRTQAGPPPALPERIGLSGPSVFGTHGAAGGPEAPPRPPAPEVFGAGWPVAQPASGSGFAPPAHTRSSGHGFAVPPPAPQAPEGATPALRASARRVEQNLDLDLEGEFLGRAPFTQTTPVVTGSDSEPFAGPIRAVNPEPDTEAARPSAPIDSVPSAPSASPAAPWTPPVGAPSPTRLPYPAGADAHYETSAEVSAVAGAPTMGAPRSARTSVSAQHTEAEIPDDAAFDETFIASRRRTAWTLVPPLGAPLPITGEVVILGRRPGFDAEFADAQLIPLSDETRTVSKTHARLELHGDRWLIVDLDSTNGVILISPDGDETDAAPGVAEVLTERFLLGDAELQVRKEGE